MIWVWGRAKEGGLNGTRVSLRKCVSRKDVVIIESVVETIKQSAFAL